MTNFKLHNISLQSDLAMMHDSKDDGNEYSNFKTLLKSQIKTIEIEKTLPLCVQKNAFVIFFLNRQYQLTFRYCHFL